MCIRDSVYAVEHNGRLRKYYKITQQGRERIGEFLNEWETVLKVYQFIKGEVQSLSLIHI